MNKFFFLVTLSSVLAVPLKAQVQDSTGLPGDNFSLSGALEMFKKAGSAEEFEKLVNTEGNKVNNLDLNGDGDIDYVKVIDKKDGDAHAFILQAAVSETEDQDIAVIEVEKSGNDEAVLQIVGDEDIYGEQTIVEPVVEKSTAKTKTSTTVVNVWTWPMVRHVYGPSYVVWASPWGWRAHPVWWRPWRPIHYRVFYPYSAPYRSRYVVVHNHRVVHAHRVYTPVRTTSVIVHSRNQASINHYRTNRTSKSVTVQKTNGQVKATQKSTTVHGRSGKATKTSTRVRKKKG